MDFKWFIRLIRTSGARFTQMVLQAHQDFRWFIGTSWSSGSDGSSGLRYRVSGSSGTSGR
jgi:hypothetical protein